MLNAAMARPAASPLPRLEAATVTALPAEAAQIVRDAVDARPELSAGRAEIDRADADIRVMRSMYMPMAMVRTGPAYTMTDKFGWMLMVGVSIPLWRGKLSGGVAEAEAMASMARADVAAMQVMIEGEAARARAQGLSVRERYLALRDQVVPKSKLAVEATLAAYVSGQLPLVSVVESAQALWMAQGDLIMAEAELGVSWARLDRALGVSGAGHDRAEVSALRPGRCRRHGSTGLARRAVWTQWLRRRHAGPRRNEHAGHEHAWHGHGRRRGATARGVRRHQD